MTGELSAYLDLETIDWQLRARCKGKPTDLFFPGQWEGTARRAKRICYQCPVRQECLDYAVENNISEGIWGGMSKRERILYRKSLKENDGN